MEPFYFGDPERALFGAYHPPKGGSIRKTGIVLCYPMGQEYMRAHRAFLRLAILLAGAGFHVMRFDYFGCGDSEGSCSQWSISRWVDDVGLAIGELRSGCDATGVCLVGLRLGASLSLMAGVKRGDVEGIVLWDPIVDGASYREELLASHNEWLRGSFAKPRTQTDSRPAAEVLGFPLTEAMAEDLDKIDLLSVQQTAGRKVYLVECAETSGGRELAAQLRANGSAVDYERIPSPKIWLKSADDMDKGLVPTKVLEAVRSWTSKVLP